MPTNEEIAQIFPDMVSRFVPSKAEGVDAVIQFNLSGENGGLFWIKVSNGTCTSGVGEVENPRMTLKAAADDWYAVSTGKLNAMQAFMSGKLKIEGDMGMAMKLQTMFSQ